MDEEWDEIDEIDESGGGILWGRVGTDDYIYLYVCTGCTHLYR